MGSGTPNHVNDPVVSGVWRPRDRHSYFDHDSTANIAAIGQYRGTLDGVSELSELYRNGNVPPDCMLTSSYHIRPAAIIAPGGIAAIEDTIIVPVDAMRVAGLALPTDFTSLVECWQTSFGSRGFLYNAESASGVGSDIPVPGPAVVFGSCSPNPFTTGTAVMYSLSRPARIRLVVFDVFGRERAVLTEGLRTPGSHVVFWEAEGLAGGTYFLRLQRLEGGPAPAAIKKLVLVR
jgi:hypothetical protein